MGLDHSVGHPVLAGLLTVSERGSARPGMRGTINQSNFSLPSLLLSLLGAIILLAIVDFIRRSTVR